MELKEMSVAEKTALSRESAPSLDLPGGPFRMNGSDGLGYLRTVLEMGEKADRFLFEITRNNYLAFGALSIAGTGIFSGADRVTTVSLICIAVIAISLGSSTLSFFYFRYSSSLFAKAWMIEKAWLRGQRSDNLLAKYKPDRVVPGATHVPDSKPASSTQNASLALSYERNRRWPFTFYPIVNLFPAIGAAAIIFLVRSGYLTFKP